MLLLLQASTQGYAFERLNSALLGYSDLRGRRIQLLEASQKRIK